MLYKHSPYKKAHSFAIQPKNHTLDVCAQQTLHNMLACLTSNELAEIEPSLYDIILHYLSLYDFSTIPTLG